MNNPHLKEEVLNKQFGRLYVESTFVGERGRLYTNCICSCGNKVKVNASNLKRGSKKSCGCLKKEHLKSFIGNLARGKQPAHTKPVGEAAMNYVYKNYKGSAKLRDLVFEISKEDFSLLTKMDCHYCDMKPSTLMNDSRLNGAYVYNGLDRKDSSLGYIKQNVVTCCESCNRLKSDLVSYSEFLEIIKVLKLLRGPLIW
jgi:hypothetical protein